LQRAKGEKKRRRRKKEGELEHAPNSKTKEKEYNSCIFPRWGDWCEGKMIIWRIPKKNGEMGGEKTGKEKKNEKQKYI